jgi:hypothetical protein
MDLPVITPMSKLHKQLAWAIAAREQLDFYQCRDQVQHLYQGSRAVRSDLINFKVDQTLLKNTWRHHSHLDYFKQDFAPWLQEHSSNRISGLEQYQPNFSAGTTQAFDSFYFRHRTRRFRCFVGEYFYHLKTWLSNDVAWSFITDHDPLVVGDALVISAPFCDTGGMHPDFDAVIAHCNHVGIPVLVDACYYVISGGVELDVSAECIDTVAFSLSKAFPVANLRIGMRYTRNTFDGQSLHDAINYNNTLSAQIGSLLIRNHGSDYIYNHYREQQLEFCNAVGLVASDSVLFAVGDRSWNEYNRSNLLQQYQLTFDPDLFVNRICLTPVFENWDLFELLKNENTITV